MLDAADPPEAVGPVRVFGPVGAFGALVGPELTEAIASGALALAGVCGGGVETDSFLHAIVARSDAKTSHAYVLIDRQFSPVLASSTSRNFASADEEVVALSIGAVNVNAVPGSRFAN